MFLLFEPALKKKITFHLNQLKNLKALNKRTFINVLIFFLSPAEYQFPVPSVLEKP